MSQKHPVDLYLGKKLSEIRKKRKFSQEQLGKSISLSHQQIQKYESGEIRLATSTLCDISKVLNINMNYFLDGIERINSYFIPEKDILTSTRTSPLKILIVEDNASDASLTKNAIDSSGLSAESHHVTDGVTALSFLRNVKEINVFPRPELILLDLNIPKKNGIEVLREIKMDINIRDIPVVIITNSISAEEMRTIYRNGASGFIVKSFYPEEFFKKVKVVIDYWYNMVLPSM